MIVSDPIRHDTDKGRFYETADGTFPSVTNIIESVLAKPALKFWAANVEREMVVQAAAELYQDAPASPKMSRMVYVNTLKQRLGKLRAHQKKSQTALDIGGACHELVEWNVRRELGQEPGPEPRVPGEAAVAFAEYERWRQGVAFKPLRVEQKVWNAGAGYAGTLDILGEIDGELAIVDFKTSKAVYPEFALQIAAYGEAVNAMGHGPVNRGFIVRLPKRVNDGFEIMEVPDFAVPYSVFLNLITVYKWRSSLEREAAADATNAA